MGVIPLQLTPPEGSLVENNMDKSNDDFPMVLRGALVHKVHGRPKGRGKIERTYFSTLEKLPKLEDPTTDEVAEVVRSVKGDVYASLKKDMRVGVWVRK